MTLITPMAIVALLGALWASRTDLAEGKVYNALTLPMMAVGLIMNLVLTPWTAGVYGLFLALAIYYPLWMMGLQRGGDGKLWMGIGALLGPWFVLEASAWYAVLYLPAGLVVLAVRGRLKNFVFALLWTARKSLGLPVEERPEPTMLRTAPVITAAGLVAFCTPWMEQLFGWVPS